jgi:hypothetical protein
MDLLNLNKMKGKLIKTDNGYILDGDNLPNPRRLSIQNCDEIFGVVDVEKLAKEETRKFLGHDVPENIMLFIAHSKMFQVGFQKAMELYQPTEIEVEIVMDKIPADLAPGGWDVFPKLDSQECIILKRVV